MRRFARALVSLMLLAAPAGAESAMAQTTNSIIQVPARVDTDQESVEFSGFVTALGGVTLTAGDESVSVGDDGSFGLRRAVPLGKSTITLVAKDADGNVLDQRRVYVRRTIHAAVAIADVVGNYYALVIGNNDYEHLEDLESAVADAESISKILSENYGYTVRTLIDATRHDIVSALNDLRADLVNSDKLLIYYAGHGNLDRGSGRGYWLPVNAEEDNLAEWISIATITDVLKAMTTKHVLVVADSCFSGSLTWSTNAELTVGTKRLAWLKRVAVKRSRTALTSGGLEPVLDKGGGGHSVFAKAFLEALRENGDVLEGQELFERVRGQVVLDSPQTPQYAAIRGAGHEDGEFLFIPVNIDVKGTVAIPGEAPPPEHSVFDERALELTFWESIKDSRKARDFEAYLAQFPAGAFASLARSRLEDLKEAKQVALPPRIAVAPMDIEFVAVKNANMRAGPSAESEKIGYLTPGTTVTVTGKVKDAEWYRVEREDGETAYVYAKLLDEPLVEPLARPQGADPHAVELTFWDSVKNSANAADYEAYLQTFPEGRFASLARARAKRYAAVKVPPSPAPTSPAQPAVGIYTEPKKAGDTFRDCPDCPEIVVIPAGSFSMGAAMSETERERVSEGFASWERPVHKVRIPRPFAMGKNEVSRGEFAAFVGASGHETSDGCWVFDREWFVDSARDWRDPGFAQSDSHPIVCVNWADPKAYVRWLIQETGKDYRLPSEAGWEYAARAKSTTARYWENNSGEACNYANVHDQISKSENEISWEPHDCRDGYGQTAPVGSYQANGFGLHDVLGNVWEWVEDCWNDSYTGAPSNGSAWTTGDCSRRGLRGGTWYYAPKYFRSALRYRFFTSRQYTGGGFRVARTLSP